MSAVLLYEKPSHELQLVLFDGEVESNHSRVLTPAQQESMAIRWLI